MSSRAILQATALALLAALLFPPVDFLSEGYGGVTPDRYVNAGFKFIGSLGVREHVRLSQWLVEFAVLLAAGALFAFAGPRLRRST